MYMYMCIHMHVYIYMYIYVYICVCVCNENNQVSEYKIEKESCIRKQSYQEIENSREEIRKLENQC